MNIDDRRRLPLRVARDGLCTHAHRATWEAVTMLNRTAQPTRDRIADIVLQLLERRAVNAVATGFIDTDMTQSLGEAERAQVVRRSALRRLADTDDVANAVEFLVGDKAKNITGTVPTVDAG